MEEQNLWFTADARVLGHRYSHVSSRRSILENCENYHIISFSYHQLSYHKNGLHQFLKNCDMIYDTSPNLYRIIIRHKKNRVIAIP
jgi:hypothetical protein